MGKIILPPKRYEEERKIIFLAGPIQGAVDWQKEAAKIIMEKLPDVDIANPRKDYIDEQFIYEEQVDWETFYLNKAAKNGVILFWLAKENVHYCERAYAQTTRFELAEWKTKHENNKNIKIVLGIEEGFSNKRYITRRINQDCPEIKICNSLKETCMEAIKAIKGVI